jgi:hypothetical protein
MAEPVLLDEAIAQAVAAQNALAQARPATPDEERMRSFRRIRLQKEIDAAKKRLADEFVGTTDSGYAGQANGHEVVATALSDELIASIANGIKPTVKELTARLDELERVVRALVETAAKGSS